MATWIEIRAGEEGHSARGRARSWGRILFRALCSFTVGLILLGSSWAKPTIHVFSVFCNAYPGEGGAINQSVTSDQYLVRGIFKEHIPEQGWGVRVRMLEIQKEDATKRRIQEQFQAFVRDVTPEDTLYVHFSGHGVILNPAAGVQLLQTCDLEFIDRKEWAASIEALPCRLKVFVTDCCSSYPPSELAEGDEEVVPWETLYFLLLRHEGFVNITAASPGQAAYGTVRGGYLTVNLESDMQRYRTWEEVFRATQARVLEETTAEIRAAGDPSLEPQRPFAYSLARPIFQTGGDQARLPEAVAYVIPDSSRRSLSRAELERLGLQQLYFARNEIFARYGYDFSTPLLARYFGSRPWYQKRPGFKSPDLSDLESRNVQLILQIEKEQGGPFLTAPKSLPGDGGSSAAADIFVYSSQRPLPRTVVQSLSLQELSLARNEIYARHGYPFRSRALQRYFGRKSWYRANPRATNPKLNSVEEQNLWLIKKIERIKGGPYQW